MSNLREAAQKLVTAWDADDELGISLALVDLTEALAQPDDKAQPVAVKYVPVDSRLRDKNWRHPNDNEPRTEACSEALRRRGDDEGQGLDGYWKWGFAAGFNAALAAPQPPAEQQATLTKSYVQVVPDKCDRIVWRNHYYHLPVDSMSKPAEQGCNCRWDGEEVLQRCELHQAWLDALSEWATRAKDAERRLREMASQKPAEQGAELNDYPPLPKHLHTAGYLAKSPPLYTADQMRAYVDADRAARGGAA